MKNFMTVIITMVVTVLTIMVIAIVKFGSVKIQTHTDNYITTCNGEVISERNEVITDSIDFNIDVNTGYNIFRR